MKNEKRNQDELGRTIYHRDAVLDALLEGKEPKGTIVLSSQDEIRKYTSAPSLNSKYTFDLPITDSEYAAQLHLDQQAHWCYPPEFEEIDILEYVYSLCSDDKERARVKVEYDYFVEANALNLLRYIVYILSVCVEQDVIWGIGRGSSVSSYLLYKLGVHSVDSLAYDLDFSEFAKDF